RKTNGFFEVEAMCVENRKYTKPLKII
ncbi:MAG: hypothetical protein ACI8Q2_000794, partial [Candidatus Omnitrophota bacterium]